MRGFALIGGMALVGLTCSSALAAGPGPFKWEGVYFGANGGVATTSTTWNNLDNFENIPTIHYGGASGVIGGQVGYNWLFPGNNWLGGIEADGDWADVRSSGPAGDDEFFSNTMKSFGTVRGRLGVISHNALFFGTAGVAFADWYHHGTDPGSTPSEQLWKSDSTRVGYTIGAGVELALQNNWSMKADLLYMDFGSETLNGITTDEANGFRMKVADSAVVVRVGANKHF